MRPWSHRNSNPQGDRSYRIKQGPPPLVPKLCLVTQVSAKLRFTAAVKPPLRTQALALWLVKSLAAAMVNAPITTGLPNAFRNHGLSCTVCCKASGFSLRA